MQYVAANADSKALDLVEVVPQCQQIEQTLRGMLVRSVARIDHIGFNSFCQECCSSRGRMTHHHHVDAHRFKIPRRVHECLALGHTRCRSRDVHGIGRESLLGEFERHPCSRRILKEEIDDGLTSQRGHLLDRALADLLEWLCSIEDQSNLLTAERLKPQKVLPQRSRCGHSNRLDTSTTADRPSRSSTSTSTRSPGRASTFLPTTSGWIGSSRPPRSISTASSIRAGRPKSASSSSAARMVRPVNRTSSTITTVLPSMAPGMSVAPTTGLGPIVCRSSRYSVISSAPRGTVTPSLALIRATIRSASCTPRRWMPTITRLSVPPFASTISPAMRRRVRSTALESRMVSVCSVIRLKYTRWSLLSRAADDGTGTLLHDLDRFDMIRFLAQFAVRFGE